ncbi:MAG: YwaF family protein [Clostridia bacterium]|nr:YwaF family protein [Clostridia bacterium]
MYYFFHGLLSDKKGGAIFTLFSFWHFLYIGLTLSVIIALLVLLKGKDEHSRGKTAKVFINIAFGLYIADFFLMPLAYGKIDIEKLPFHACTAMCVMCFLSYHIPFLEKYRTSFVLLGFVSNFVYLIYPAGVMWHGVHPSSYRVIQTLIFHSAMTIYGFLALTFNGNNLGIKKSYKHLIVVVCMTLWAMLGNNIYNGDSEGYSHFFNWFFVVRDPFYILSESISPFVMPIINITAFYLTELLMCFVFSKLYKLSKYEKRD